MKYTSQAPNSKTSIDMLKEFLSYEQEMQWTFLRYDKGLSRMGAFYDVLSEEQQEKLDTMPNLFKFDTFDAIFAAIDFLTKP